MLRFFLVYFLLFSLNPQIYGQSCGDDVLWKIGTSFGTQRLSFNCGDFNCHGFAGAYWENGLDNSVQAWNQAILGTVTVTNPFRFSTGGPAQNYFQNSEKYVRICNQNLANVDVITQRFNTQGGFHSLVRDRSTNSFNLRFISKYGTDSPVIGHEFNSTWYELINQTKIETDKYYVFIGKLKSNDIIPQNLNKNNSSNLNTWSKLSMEY